MREVKFRFITLTLILSIILALPAFATQNTSDRASEQLRSYFMDARNAGNGEIIITFSVDGTRKMEQIGAERIVVFNKVGGVWSIVESWSKDDSGMTASNAYYYGNTMYFNGKVGTEYRVTDSNLNHTGIYLYSKGKIMIHLTFDYQSDEGCTTPGQYLRYHRTFQGLTTRELAEKVGVVPATLVLYENDRHPIKHSTAVALANVLGIDRSRLLDEYTVFVDYPYSSLLKKVRRELSFTQMQMAEVIGIGQTTYSGWEREVRVPRRKEHEKILAAMKKLKVDVDTYLCQPNPL